MLEILNVVKGAVSSKDLLPVLTHFALHDGRICGYNGRVYIDAPYAYADQTSFTVPAAEFIAAMEVCEEKSSTFSVADGFLNITSGHFRARLPIRTLQDFPVVVPEGKRQSFRKKGEAFRSAIRMLRPFIGEDASRPWSSGILLQGAKAIATNNIVIAEVGLPITMPVGVTIPAFAIDELLRLNDYELLSYSQTPEAVVFYFAEDIWLRTKLLPGEWPAGALTMIREYHSKANWQKVPAGLREAVEAIKPFCANQVVPVVRLSDNRISTEGETMSAEVRGFKHLGECAFRVDPLLAVLQWAKEFDLSQFPRISWRDSIISGVMVGNVL